MTNDKLNEIHRRMMGGETVEGWGGTSSPEKDTAVRHDGAAWERDPPDGRWHPLKGMGHNA